MLRVDLIVIGAIACAALAALALIVARQRHMLSRPGGIPLAARTGNRWLYGVGVYVGDELRWYRAFGFGRRPSRVLRRPDLVLERRRPPAKNERSSLPPGAVVVEIRDTTGKISLALEDGAYTGFVSWLEASAPGT